MNPTTLPRNSIFHRLPYEGFWKIPQLGWLVSKWKHLKGVHPASGTQPGFHKGGNSGTLFPANLKFLKPLLAIQLQQMLTISCYQLKLANIDGG